MVALRAIIPRKGVQRALNQGAVNVGVQKALRGFAFSVVREMSQYPPARPWKNPPRSGPRAGGRRTGTYARNWAQGVRFGRDSVTIVNRASERGKTYSGYVGGVRRGSGTRQARFMRARGWKSIDDILPRLRKEFGLSVRKNVFGN